MDSRMPEAVRDVGHDGGRAVRMSTGLFLSVEHGIMIALGAVLSLTALLALGGAAVQLWDGVMGAGSAKALLVIVDRLLFVLMIVEILHTVRVSIRSGELTCEPFLIVGLIASMRRVLVITMQAAKMTEQTPPPGVDLAATAFRNTMIELGLLGFLIMVFVFAIYLLRKSGSPEDLLAH